MNGLQRRANDPPGFALTRRYDAPRNLVFQVWTDPRFVAEWWGVEGATNPECELDVRPDGRWRIVMRTASGRLYANSGTYLEVVPDRRLVYWLGFVAAVLGPMHAFQAFSLAFFAITSGGVLVTLLVSGAILGAWR